MTRTNLPSLERRRRTRSRTNVAAAASMLLFPLWISMIVVVLVVVDGSTTTITNEQESVCTNTNAGNGPEDCSSSTTTTTPSLPLVYRPDQDKYETIDESHFEARHCVSQKKDDASTSPTTTTAAEPYFVLNEKKPILYIPDFLNATAATELSSFCSTRFVSSQIRGHGSDGSTVSQDKTLRTSESCSMVPATTYLSNPQFLEMLKDPNVSPQVAAIGRETYLSWDIANRASHFVEGLDPHTVEPLQMVRYTSPEAFYEEHHDHGGYYGKATEHRSWTLLIYVNTLPQGSGGHTAFSQLNLEVVPRAGDAILWSNTMDGKADPDMVHMGKPPSQEGVEKMAVNVWFGVESFDQRRQSELSSW